MLEKRYQRRAEEGERDGPGQLSFRGVSFFTLRLD